MATIKFSAFTNEAVDITDTQLVGYKVGDTSANYRYDIAQLATALSPSIPTIYSTDASIAASRTVTIPAAMTLDFATAAAADAIVKINGYQFYDWMGSIPTLLASSTGRFMISSYNSEFRYNYIKLYGSAAFNGTSTGLVTLSGTTGTTYNIGARLGIVSTGNTDATYSFITQNSDSDETFSVRDDGVVKISGQGYTELYDTVNTTLTVDWNNSNIQELTSLTGLHTFTASNPQIGATYILTLGQTGAVTPTWTGVKWPAATAPTLSGAGKTDIITLICYDATGAGLYYGTSTLNFTT